MIVEIIDEKRKLYYKAVNGSMVLFTLIWMFIFIGNYISEIAQFTLLDCILTYLLLGSILPLLSGLASAIALYLIGNTFVEVGETNKVTLILNMNEYDYKVDQFRLLPYSGNFLELDNENLKFEISAQQVEEITSVYSSDRFRIKFQRQRTSMLIEPPKHMFNNLIFTLWAMS